MNIKTKTKRLDAKRFSWNLKLNNNLLQILKTHFDLMSQEIALIFIKKYPHLPLNTLQIKRHLKYLKSKEKKSHVNISIFSANNEHYSNNVIENISIKCINNISKKKSSNITNEGIHVQLKKEENFYYVLPSLNGKMNICHKNLLKYKEDIKDIVKHVCYCCQRLHFQYQISIVSKPYIEKIPNELNNGKNLKDVIICKFCKRNFDIGKPFDLVLQNYIITNKLDMKFLLMLNKI
jgi:hypothetical protein